MNFHLRPSLLLEWLTDNEGEQRVEYRLIQPVWIAGYLTKGILWEALFTIHLFPSLVIVDTSDR